MKIIKAAFKFKRYDNSIDVGHNLTLSVWMRETAVNSWFRSIAVITLSSHARGPGFDPQRNHLHYSFVKFVLEIFL